MTERATCKDCRFWEAGDRWGECKRRGPLGMTEQGWAYWPKTQASNWCGEHEPEAVKLRYGIAHVDITKLQKANPNA